MAKRTCSIDGCEKLVLARGWCSMHYQRWHQNGDPLAVLREWVGSICAVDGCDRPNFGHGWCQKHYTRWRKHGDPSYVIGQSSVSERLWARVDKDGPPVPGHPEMGPCWLWIGATASKGYGHMTGVVSCGRSLVHRVAYELEVGEIPEGLHLDHLCHTLDHACDLRDECPHRRCVNPGHLEPVTPAENTRRGREGKAPVTHCKRGHEFTPENTYHHGGSRHCRACRSERTSEQRRRRKGRST